MAKPVVDRGYAWVILVASFVLQLFSIGISVGGIGVMLVSFSKVFPQADVGQISWIGSLRCFQLLASPIAVLMIKRFGCRVTTIVGALVTATGVALSSLSTEIWHAYLTFGVLAGIGVAFTFTSSTAVLGEYFDKRKNIAFPVSCLGNSVGVLVFPYILQIILDSKRHNVALYITAALNVVEIACGAVFKPNNANPLSTPAAGEAAAGSNVSYGNDTTPAAKEIGVLDERADTAGKHNSKTLTSTELYVLPPRDGIDAKGCQTPVLTESDLLKNYSSGSTIALIVSTEELELSDLTGGAQNSDQPSAQRQENSFLRMMYLLRDWKCWLLLLHAFAWGFAVAATQVLGPMSMQRRGLSETDASLGVAILGAGMLAISFIMLGVGARQYDRFALYLPMCGLLGIAAILLAVFDHAVPYFIIFGTFGCLFGILISLFLTIVSDFKTADDYADLFGLYELFNGIGGIAGPAAVGSIQAHVSDSVGWYTAGSVGIVGSLLLVPIYLIKRRQRTEQPAANSAVEQKHI